MPEVEHVGLRSVPNYSNLFRAMRAWDRIPHRKPSQRSAILLIERQVWIVVPVRKEMPFGFEVGHAHFQEPEVLVGDQVASP